MNLSLIDVVILILLGFGAYRGFKKGFLVEVIALLGLVLSLVGAIVFLDFGVAHFKVYFHEYQNFLPYVSFIGIFILLLLLFSFIAKLISSAISMTVLGSLDRFIGAGFGVLKWVFGISLFFWFAKDLGFDMNLKAKSVLLDKIEEIAPRLINFIMPYWPEVKKMFEEVSQLITN